MKKTLIIIIGIFVSLFSYGQSFPYEYTYGTDYTDWTVYQNVNITEYWRNDGMDSVLFLNCTWDSEDFGTGSVVYLDSNSFIHFKNCTILNMRSTGSADYHWLNITRKDSNIWVENCYGLNQSADFMQIGLSHDTTDPTDYMRNLWVTNNRLGTDNGVSTENAIDVKGCDDLYIGDNTLWGFRGCSNEGCSGDIGIAIVIHRWSSKNVLIEGNNVYNNTSAIQSGSGAEPRSGPPENVTIRNNTIHDNSSHITFLSYVENPQIYNNTFGDYSNFVIRTNGSTGDTLFANNVLGYTGSYSEGDIIRDSYYNMGGWNNVWKELNSSDFLDATNADTASRNYRLTATATDLIDQSVDISSYYSGVLYDYDSVARPVGVADDIGAFEYSGGCPSIGVTVTTVSDTNNSGVGSATITAITNIDYPATYLWSNSDTDSIASDLVAGAYSAVATGDSGCTGSWNGEVPNYTTGLYSVDSININFTTTLDESGWISVPGASDTQVDLGDSRTLTPGANDYTSGDGGCTGEPFDTASFTYHWAETVNDTNKYLLEGFDSDKTYSILVGVNRDATATNRISRIDFNGVVDTLDAQQCGEEVMFIGVQPNVSGEILMQVSVPTASTFGYINYIILYDSTIVNITPTLVGVNVDCFGNDNGTITTTVEGGTAPYTFEWDDGPTTQNRSGLSGGEYKVTITDDALNSVRDSIIITEPSQIVITEAIQDATYSQYNGAIILSIAGGTFPFTYSWTGSEGFTSTDQNIVDIDSGSYSVTVTDAELCQKVGNYTVENTTPLDTLYWSNTTTMSDWFGIINIAIDSLNSSISTDLDTLQTNVDTRGTMVIKTNEFIKRFNNDTILSTDNLDNFVIKTNVAIKQVE